MTTIVVPVTSGENPTEEKLINTIMRSTEIKVTIPKCLIDVGYRFLNILPKSKLPSEKWSIKNYSANDAPIRSWINNYQSTDRVNKISGEVTHYEGIGNYGVIGSETAIIIEVDTPEMVEYSMKHPVIGKTLRARSGSQIGNHYYIRTDKGWTIPMLHPTLFDEKGKRNTNVGHIKAKGSYCVGPSSIHPKGNAYELLNEGTDILYMPFAEIVEYYKSFILLKHKEEPVDKIYKSPVAEKNSAAYFGLSMDMFMPIGKLTTSGDEIIGASRWHESKTGTNYRVNLKKGVWKCEHCNTGDTAVVAYAIERNIISCDKAGRGCLDGKWSEMYKAREADGWINPDKLDTEWVEDFMKNTTEKDKPEIITVEAKEDAIDENDAVFSYDNIPDDNIVIQYVKYASKVQDAYPEYHMANILSFLSFVTPAYMNPSFGKVHNNAWLFNIGTAGQSGKSTTTNLIKGIYNEIIDLNKPALLSDKITPESYVDEMSKRNIRYWLIDEASSIMKLTKRDYASEMIENILLTYSHQTLSRTTVEKKNKNGEVTGGGTKKCEHPHVGMCWFTTPESFLKNTTGYNDFDSGLYQRPMFVIPNRRKEVYKDRERTVKEMEEYNGILNRISELYHLTNDKDILFHENEILNEWKLKSRQKLSEDKNVGSLIGGGITRSYEHCRKLAMLLTIGSMEFFEYIKANTKTEVDDNGIKTTTKYYRVVIPDWAAKVAIEWTERFFHNYRKVIKMVATNNGGSNSMVIKALSDAGDWVSKQELQDTVKKYGRVWNDLIRDMKEDNLIDEKRIEQKGRGKPRTMYKLI
ncbi:MAG: bifunctional DNA primase/polymerase [Candidatus Paceibacterota bacterium]|jgi:hypothetical protein